MGRILIVIGDRTADEVIEAAYLAFPNHYSKIEKLYFESDKFLQEDAPRLRQLYSEIHYICGIASDDFKKTVVAACDQQRWIPVSVAHPMACISQSAQLGRGVFVGPMAVVSSNARIGNHSIIHIHASVGHDVSVGDYSAVLPGARISGGVQIGDRSLVGSNAFVAAGVIIGMDCRVDALSYIRDDLPDRHMFSPRHPRAVERIEFRAT
jgi:UDP-3-O-[3-hydroxymyristoyl] glucosamine N-acyltransferase